jgi:hypothetical protein
MGPLSRASQPKRTGRTASVAGRPVTWGYINTRSSPNPRQQPLFLSRRRTQRPIIRDGCRHCDEAQAPEFRIGEPKTSVAVRGRGVAVVLERSLGREPPDCVIDMNDVPPVGFRHI